ncbi:hypothetical protein E2542_SST23654 [Spatholobus suberectus]|nr:hypothetical protein E2542_SST23654 [Spatholobus suberectus]
MVVSQHHRQFQRRLFHTTSQLLILAIGRTVGKVHARRTGHIHTDANADPIILIFSTSPFFLVTVNVLLDLIVQDLESKLQIQPVVAVKRAQPQSSQEGSIGSLCC